MRKLLGFLLLVGLCALLVLGSVGCGKKDEKMNTDAKQDTDTKPKKDADTKLKKDAGAKARITDLELKFDDITLPSEKGTTREGQLGVSFKRENFKDEVTLNFSEVPGVTFKGGTVAKDKESIILPVLVDATAAAGEYEVTVTASGGGTSAETKGKLKIKKAE